MRQRRPGVGMTGFASLPPVAAAEPAPRANCEVLQDIHGVLAGKRFALLTGAGLSTDSGIPDYRGPGAAPRAPMTYQEFIGDAENRAALLGAQPHRLVAPAPGGPQRRPCGRWPGWNSRGLLTGLITQNVDRLHEDAGSVNVVDLHGRFDQVVCLDCQRRTAARCWPACWRNSTPGSWTGPAAGVVEMAPDADATVEDSDLIERFVVAICPACGGTLKPDFVYFGENVPKDRVERSYAMVDAAGALLVAGSSLTVMSGLRFVRHAAKQGKAVVIINRGADPRRRPGHRQARGRRQRIPDLARRRTARASEQFRRLERRPSRLAFPRRSPVEFLFVG